MSDPKKLGELLVKCSVVSPAQLQWALDKQKKLDAGGKPHSRIGQVMVDFGILPAPQLERFLQVQALENKTVT